MIITVQVHKSKLTKKSGAYDVIMKQGDDNLVITAHNQEAADRIAKEITKAIFYDSSTLVCRLKMEVE